MTRLTASRCMDGAGLLLLGVALFFYAAQGRLTAPPARTGVPDYGFVGAAQAIFVYLCFWMSASVGALLFLGRPMLRLGWRYGWIALLAVGALLWTEGPELVGPSYGPIGGSLLFSYWDMNVKFLELACILMGPIFLIAQ